MKKPLAIGATLALAIALTGCQQPKPAAPPAVEPPVVAPVQMPPVATPPPTETGASLTIAPSVEPTKEVQNAESPAVLEIQPTPAATTTDVKTDATLNIAPAPGEAPVVPTPMPGAPLPPPTMP